jgi:hypothetical protein
MWTEHYPPGLNAAAQVYQNSHFIGFNNQNFDCHPEGIAILFKNSSINLEIHGRYTPVSQTIRPSVIDAVALKVNLEIIQYTVDNGSFLVDGKPCGFINNWCFLSKSQTSIVMDNASKFHIYTASGPRLTVHNYGYYNLNIMLSVPRIHAQKAEPSLFGTLTGGHGQMIRGTGLFLSR